MSSEPPRSKLSLLKRLPDIAWALIVGVGAFAWLSYVNPDPPVSHDAVRDLLFSRDCVELNQCHVIGAAASVPGIYQGAIWLNLLTIVQFFGGDTLAARAVILALLSLGLASMFLVTWRWISLTLAIPATIVATAVLSLGAVPTLLINPSAVFFPDAICACALLIFTATEKRRFLVLAAFMLSLAIDTHVGALSLIPSVLVLSCLGCARPILTALLASSVFLTTHLLTSRAAFVANLMGLVSRGRFLLVVLGILVLLLVTPRLNAWFRRQSRSMRALGTGLILVGPFTLGTLWLIVREAHGFNVTYWHPVIAPGAVLLAALFAVPLEWFTRNRRENLRKTTRALPTALALTALLLSGRASMHLYYFDTNTWTFDDSRRIAERLGQHGWSFEQMLTRVQGAFCLDLVNGLSVYAAKPAGTTVEGRKQVRVWRVPESKAVNLPPEVQVVPLRNGKAAVLSEITTWINPEQVKACRQQIGAKAPECVPTLSGDSEQVDAISFLYSERSFPHVDALETPSPYVATYEMRVMPTPGESRDIEVFDEGAPPNCGWEIARVEGLDLEQRFSPTHVRIHATGGRSGQLIVQKSYGGPKCPSPENRNYTTCVLETSPAEVALRALGEVGR